MRDTLCGFCIFNNVAIAAKHAVDTLGVKKFVHMININNIDMIYSHSVAEILLIEYQI